MEFIYDLSVIPQREFMVDAGRKQLEQMIQMNLLQHQQIVDRPYPKSLVNLPSSTCSLPSMPTYNNGGTTSPKIAGKSTTDSTLEQLQLQYQHIMAQMQLSLPQHSATTTYPLSQQVINQIITYCHKQNLRSLA